MPCTRSEERPARDAGMVTAELAACLPVLLMLVGAVLGAVAVVSGHVRAQDAAREAARAYARGDDAAAGRLVRQALPAAHITRTRQGQDVTVVVSTEIRPLGRLLPSVTVTERAVAALEPSADP